MAYSFQAKIASRGYHVYKSLTWSDVKQGDLVTVEIETDKESRKIDPYCCAIKAMVGIPPQLKTVGHVPREISRHTFFYLKEENGKIDGLVHSTQYRPSPIPAGGLEIPLMLTFKSKTFITHEKMKGFITSLYSYEYETINAEGDDDEDDHEFHFMIEKEDVDNSELLRRNIKRKAPIILETSSSSSESELEKDPSL